MDWRGAVLHQIGAPATPGNLHLLDAWEHAEGTAAANNPLATTQPAPGASTFNSVGVKNYATPEAGVHATAQTLLNGRYGQVVGLLRSGTASPVAIGQAVAASPWGTGRLILKVLGAPSPASQQPAAAPTGSVPVGAAPDLSSYALNNLTQMAQGSYHPPSAQLAELAQTLAAPTATSGHVTASAPVGHTGGTAATIEQYAAPYGLTVTSTTGGQHAPHSYHYQGRAVDFGGDPQRMAALAHAALQDAQHWAELIYTGPGNPGYSILQGRVIPNSELPKALFDEHVNHVHIAL